MAYAGPAMALTTSATFGPVVHQHVGAGATTYSVAFAAAFGLESAQAGMTCRRPTRTLPQRRRATWPRARTTSSTARYRDRGMIPDTTSSRSSFPD